MNGKRSLSRAESARLRRAQRAAQELQQTTQRALKPMVKPITKRVTSMPKPTFQQIQRKRRFQVALGIPDISMRRPSFGMSPQYRGWRFFSLFIALVLGLMVYLALALPYFNIPSVTVLGNERLTREEISNAAAVMGQSIFTIQPQDVELRLRMNYPELLSVKVEVYLPNHVYVTIEERQPVILWQQDGAYTWIDENGVAFRPTGTVEGLVSVNGLSTPPPGSVDEANPLVPPPYMQKELAQAILLLAPHVPPDATMLYDGTYGLGWVDARGWKAFFGSTAFDMPLKVRVYESLVQSLQARNIYPALISVVYPEAPYYRLSVRPGAEE